MSRSDTKSKRGKAAKKAARKPPPRWRRYLVQAELELPPPSSAAGTATRSGSGDDDDEHAVVTLRWWQTRLACAGFAAVCALLLVTTAWSLYRSGTDREYARVARASVQKLTLRASSNERDLRIAPNPRSWSAAPDASLHAPEPPEMLNLFFPVGYTNYPSFAVIIDKVDHGRVLTVQRVSPDSNRDLRLSLNSSALGPGEYRIRLQGYSWQGKRVDVGWVRLLIR